MALFQYFAALTKPTATKLNEKSLPVVSANTDISVPHVGQIIFNSTDTRLYRNIDNTSTGWRVFSGGPSWALRRAASQAITSTTFTFVSWDTEDSDPSGVHVAGSDTVTVNQDGFYALSAKGGWSADADGTRYVDMTHNGVIIPGSSNRVPSNGAVDVAVAATPTIFRQLASGDTLGVRMWHNAGVGVTTATASADQPLFGGTWLRD